MFVHFPMLYRIATFSVVLATCASTVAEEPVSFNRDVRPILSDKCFHCHGPDGQKREADLRLDDRNIATETGAIVVGKPDDSDLMRRIVSTDDDQRMPPVASKLERLTDQEVATLRRWIEGGAEYEDHWAFIAPQTAAGTHHEPDGLFVVGQAAQVETQQRAHHPGRGRAQQRRGQ